MRAGLSAGRLGAGRFSVDQFDQASELVGVGGGQDAMAKVEDVAVASGHGQHGPGLFGQDGPGGEAGGGVEVSLYAYPGTDPAAGLVQRYPPVDAYHVGAGPGEVGQQLSRPDAENDAGDLLVTEAAHDAVERGPHVTAVVSGEEGTAPALENLDGGRPAATWAWRLARVIRPGAA